MFSASYSECYMKKPILGQLSIVENPCLFYFTEIPLIHPHAHTQHSESQNQARLRLLDYLPRTRIRFALIS